MALYEEVKSIGVANHKCFDSPPQGFEEIKPINIIIGRNSSGKSSLLDLIEYAVWLSKKNYNGERKEQVLQQCKKGKNNQQTLIVTRQPILEEYFPKLFDMRQPQGRQFAQQCFGNDIFCSLELDGNYKFINYSFNATGNIWEDNGKRLAGILKNPFIGLEVKKISAERAVEPEGAHSNPLLPSGQGLTNLYRKYLNELDRPTDLVEKVILDDLNLIMSPDAHYSRIYIQQLGEGRDSWELQLKEDDKGTVKLSDSGSGLKTVLFVLAYIHLVPDLEKKTLNKYVFLFEELENNLHPALQRRLHKYIRDKCKKHKCTFFMTTHSNVVIDIYGQDPISQIVHVTHDGKSSVANTVKTYVQNKGILDDLDVRASDLLQSNGIIWVEGPSDRLYFNRWIELFSGGELKENIHYQCIPYGGRLLAHLDANDPDVDPQELVKILRVNSNAIIMIDSDFSPSKQNLSSTKQRIAQEISNMNGLAWVTEGKEIENYIPKQAIQQLYSKCGKQVGKFQSFPEYLNKWEKGAGEKFKRGKPMFAEKIIPHITLEDSKRMHDLEERMNECISYIKNWNKL
ncbi:MAG: AAA family ATPase [Alphaproteobacteria bacterium]|nr:AAA family ATPase [Alphaproteobacteria bacterium]